jgi:3'(2'), 5'-bisphosphate nucleotidase
MSDAELAAALAEKAGSMLLRLRERGLARKALGDTADKLAHRLISDGLARNRPSDGFLSEESPDCSARLSKGRVWIVDPLDGTREYSEGRDDWAVHVALAIGGKPDTGAVAVPARRLLFRTDLAVSTAGRSPGKLRIVVSRTRPPSEAERVAQLLGAELIPLGSCGAKTMAVVSGEADIYLHSGGQYEWDSCAPVAVAQAAGFHCSRLDGSPLIYNQEDLYVPDLLICRQELASRVLEALRD